MMWISLIIYWMYLIATCTCLPSSITDPSKIIESSSLYFVEQETTDGKDIMPKNSTQPSSTGLVYVTECVKNETCVFVESCPLINTGKDNQLLKLNICDWEGIRNKVCCPSAETNSAPVSTTEDSSERQDYFFGLSNSVNVASYAFSDRNICGTIPLENRIYGGDITLPEEFPWLVRLKYRNHEGEDYYCAGSLITDRHVLTAAHCVDSTTLNLVSVRLGEWNTNTDIDCYDVDDDTMKCIDEPVDRGISRIIVHPDFFKRNLTNDIAIIKLDKPVNFTDYIQPICLPTTEYVRRQSFMTDNVIYQTAGWGLTEFETASVIKRRLSLPAISNKVCNILMKHVKEDTVICAGGRKGEDSCQGDSGGPLVRMIMENYKFNNFLLGVTSSGPRECGLEGRPGIYTRVSHYMDWIKQNVT